MTASRPTLVVEDDPFLRLVAVALDTNVDTERVQAFTDFCAHDEPDFAGWLSRLRARVGKLHPAHVVLVSSAEAMQNALPAADALIVESHEVDAATLNQAPHLKLVQKFGLLTRNIDQSACTQRQIAVRTLRRRANMACADFTMGLTVALARKICELDGLMTPSRLYDAGFSPRHFDRRHTANSNAARVSGIRAMSGVQMGIIGLGEIGRETAQRAHAFGMRLAYTKRTPLSAELEAVFDARYLPMHELLASSDFIVLHLPVDDSTRGIIGAAQFAQMKPDAMLVNAARHELVDRTALIAALSGGSLGGYAGDMPYEDDGGSIEQLLAFRNVILTPNVGAAPRFNALDDIEEMLTGVALALQLA
ncbi:MAG: NAD(P)-dependent oxidoreductase [Burkholderiales bacterium]|nr:NAD(P)-dependent oxidoreductase [Burkholderiales bacterium]